MNESRPLRVLLHVPRYWPAIGGAEMHSRELARHLRGACHVTAARHCSTETACADLAFAAGRDAVHDDDGMAVHQLAARGAARHVLRPLGRLHARLRPARGVFARLARRNLAPRLSRLAGAHDVVHSIYNGFTASVEAAAEAARARGRPFVLTPLAHTTHPPGTAWSSAQFKRLYARADALVALTEYERDWLIARGAPAESVHVCPMAPLFEGEPDPEAFRRRHAPGDAPLVLFLGRMTARKGFDTLARAAEHVWRRHPAARFVFAGPCTAESRAFFASVADPRLVVLGPLSGQEKTSALAACDLLCVPSQEESLGVVYLEAWSLARPVVALDLPVLRTVIDDGRDGLLASASETDVARCVQHLLTNPAHARAMGATGQAKCDALYHWPRIAARMTDIYRHAVSRITRRDALQFATRIRRPDASVGRERAAVPVHEATAVNGVTEERGTTSWHAA